LSASLACMRTYSTDFFSSGAFRPLSNTDQVTELVSSSFGSPICSKWTEWLAPAFDQVPSAACCFSSQRWVRSMTARSTGWTLAMSVSSCRP
jgi:hypothetical protein